MNITTLIGKSIAEAFLWRQGVYYDPIGDELFILELIGWAPCKTGQMIPHVRVFFDDDVRQGCVPNTGQVYLGRL